MSKGGLFIKINLRQRRLYLYQGEKLYNSYLVAIGKPKTPSPIGSWTIVNKYILSGRKVYGNRWMGLSNDHYGIHGNNNASVIGKAVSLGCIRMYNNDIESIFPLISIGTPVEIVSGKQDQPYQGNPPSNPQHGGKTHTIQPGDTVWSIAKRYNVSMGDIIKLNPHITPDLIYPGQVINLP